MPIVQIREHPYFYKSERVNGRPRRRYLASGELALLLAAEDARIRQADRARRDRQAEHERRIWGALEGPCRTVETIARLYLETRGYHRPGRNWWRKRRTMSTAKTAQQTAPATVPATIPLPTATVPATIPAQPSAAELKKRERQARKKLERLSHRAQNGDQAALSEILTLCDATPDTYNLFDFGECAAQSIAQEGAGRKDLLVRAVGLRLYRELVDQLHPPGTGSSIEYLMACRIALSHMAACKFEEIGANQAKIDAAHRRFLSAVRTLALIRQTAPPPVQVNVSQNVHVATAAGASTALDARSSPSPAPTPLDGTQVPTRLDGPGQP